MNRKRVHSPDTGVDSKMFRIDSDTEDLEFDVLRYLKLIILDGVDWSKSDDSEEKITKEPYDVNKWLRYILKLTNPKIVNQRQKGFYTHLGVFNKNPGILKNF